MPVHPRAGLVAVHHPTLTHIGLQPVHLGLGRSAGPVQEAGLPAFTEGCAKLLRLRRSGPFVAKMLLMLQVGNARFLAQPELPVRFQASGQLACLAPAGRVTAY